MDNLKKLAAMWKLLSPPITLLSGRKARRSLLTNWALKVGEVAIIEGKAGNASGEARRNGATEAFKKQARSSLSPASLPTGTALKHWMSPLTCCNVIRILKAIYCANDTMAMGVAQAVANAGKKREKCWSSVQMAFRKPAKWWKPDK
ncbi:substrate-binding domain-containing protein [Escherichia coli]